jgi:hypothetical protein
MYDCKKKKKNKSGFTKKCQKLNPSKIYNAQGQICNSLIDKVSSFSDLAGERI